MRRALTLIELVVVVGIVLILVALATSSFSSVVARAEEAKTQTAMRLLSAAIDAYEQGTGKRITLSRRASGAPPVEIGPEPPSAEQRRRGVQLYGMHRNGSHFLTTAELTRQLLTFKESADIIAKIDPSLLFAIRTDVFDRPPWVPIPATYNCEPDLNKVYGEARWNAARLCQPGDDPSDPNSNPYCLNTALLILDSWGQPIRAIHPGPQAQLDSNGELLEDVYPSTGAGAGLDRVMDLPRDPDGTVARLAEYQYFGQGSTDGQIRFVSAGPDLKFGLRVVGTNGAPVESANPECYQNALDNIFFGGATP